MKIEPQYFSYKDSDAYVVKSNKGFIRHIFFQYKSQYNHLMLSGLYNQLVQEGLLISHQELVFETDDANVHKTILPEQIQFISYPFEWSFLQWKKTALAFLRINQIALKYGMILKDASPYNFYLKEGKAILFDTTSFAFFQENGSWLGYRQFCEIIFAPISLMKYNGSNWAKLYMSSLKGYSMKFVSKQLPLSSWFNISCLIHIHLHALYETKKVAKSDKQKGFSIAQLNQLFQLLYSTIDSWKNPTLATPIWLNYYSNDIEEPRYLNVKEELIKDWLLLIKSDSLIDLGANTGRFSVIASKLVNRVIATDFDENCVDVIESIIENNKLKNINALVIDLSETSPSLGILNKEIPSFIERGKSDVVMALALVHHLSISNNLPFKHIADLFSCLSKRYLIVEFIPREDSKVQLLLKNRENAFPNYTEEIFRDNLSKWFKLIDRKVLKPSKRTLYLWEKKEEFINE